MQNTFEIKKNNSTYTLTQWWLIGFCALVIVMISIGGITRLTRSGLSIVEWKPIVGMIPPLSEQAWQEQFELYKKTPEYNHVNSHFELSDYKQIFLWEYLHRVLGRIIFLFVVLPGVYLWRKKLVAGRLVFALAALVAMQGLIGWLMVKSGLNVKPHVSPFMLSLHFFTALGVLLFAYFHFLKTENHLQTYVENKQRSSLNIFGLLLSMQIFFGCLTSGLKAGVGYNTYPLMNGQFFPDGGLFFKPIILNFFENPATVQWTHRWLGVTVLLSLIFTFLLLKKYNFWKQIKTTFVLLMCVICFQIVIGILNILMVVPIPLAAFHQFVATVLVLIYFKLIYLLPIKKESH